MAKKPTKKYTQKTIDVSGHKRSDPRINKKVDVSPYKREKGFKEYKNITEKTFLENIHLPKKDQAMIEKVKAGFYEKNITETEKKLFEKGYSLQMDIYNQPTEDAYQKQLNKSMKQIVKVSGIGEIFDRMHILQKSKLAISEEFEWILKGLNDDRKELELKIRGLRKEFESFSEKGRLDLGSEALPILKDINILEAKREKLVYAITSSPAQKPYKQKLEIIDKRIAKYQDQIERFYFKFLDEVNNELNAHKDKKGFKEFYLDDHLEFVAQKEEKHKVKDSSGREFTANIKVYKFEELENDLKDDILKIINKNFKEEYIKDESDQFLKSFKDKPEKQVKKGDQKNLDKQLGINTKLYEEYGSLKAFGKEQTRLTPLIKPAKPDENFDKKQLAIGKEIELEHTEDKGIAKDIAKHHLEEFPDYYKKLVPMEKELEAEEKLEKQLAQHWKDTQGERESTHSKAMYEKYLKEQKEKERKRKQEELKGRICFEKQSKKK